MVKIKQTYNEELDILTWDTEKTVKGSLRLGDIVVDLGEDCIAGFEFLNASNKIDEKQLKDNEFDI